MDGKQGREKKENKVFNWINWLKDNWEKDIIKTADVVKKKETKQLPCVRCRY